jgi:Protein of unknown function (DUF4065)
MADLRPLVSYIVDQVQDKGDTIGKTALMKLVYLADVEHYKRYGKQATGLKWRFYHYGPYTAELEPVLRSLGVDIDEQDIIGRIGTRQVTGYRYSREEIGGT